MDVHVLFKCRLLLLVREHFEARFLWGFGRGILAGV